MIATKVTPIKAGAPLVTQVEGGVALKYAPCDGFLIETDLSERKIITPTFVPSVMLGLGGDE